MTASMQARATTAARPRAVLTSRQVETLEKVGAGMTYKVAAHELGVTVPAVRARLLSARKRLGARNLPHALVLAMSRNLIVGPDGEHGNNGS